MSILKIPKPLKSIKRPQVAEEKGKVNRSDEQAAHRMQSIYYDYDIDPRRYLEAGDAGMIQEDQQGMANLPRRAQHHEFTHDGHYAWNDIDPVGEL